MPIKTHNERTQMCFDRLKQEGFFINPAMINFKTQLEEYFKKEKSPEIVTKNLLYMHQNSFNFNDPVVQRQLFATQEYSSDKVIEVLSNRELFFKYGFEHPILFARQLKQCPALSQFKEKILNKDQTSSMYFGLQALESNRYFTTSSEANASGSKKHASNLLAELDEHSYKYRIREAGEGYEEQSIDLLPERVARNFIDLRDQGYTGMFVWQENSRAAHGLTEDKLKALANPSNEGLLQSMASDIQWLGVRFGISAIRRSMASYDQHSTTRLERELEDDTNQLNLSASFLKCWATLFIKNKILDLINADDNQELRLNFQTCVIDQRTLSVTPDFLRKAFLRLPSAPKSEFNRKLLVIQQQALLETIDNIMRSDSINPIVQNIKVALRNKEVILAVDWADILMNLPIENFSAEAIAQRTLLSALAKLSPEESRSALGLEKLNEQQQAKLILELQQNGCMIKGAFEYVSTLLIKSSPAHGDLLVSYFLANKNDWQYKSCALKDLTQLAHWIRIHRKTLNQNTRECIDQVINNSLRQSIPQLQISVFDSFFNNSGINDPLHQIWLKVKKTASKDAERVYSMIKKTRESYPIDIKTISLQLSDYMTQNPQSAYTLELQNVYGDFFKEFTPSKALVRSANDIEERTASCC